MATSSDAGAVPEASVGSSTSSSGSTTTGDCLSTDPIDAGGYAYVKASPAFANACTAEELNILSAYYKDNIDNAEFSAQAWGGQVSEECSGCAFTNDDPENPPSTWNPVLIKNDGVESIDQGGCIEHVSGSFDCGKAFQQLQTCEVNACLVKCESQTDFNTCRQDQTVLTTACKGAVDAVQAACGTAIQNYQNLCNSTNFAFEGPIRVACIAVPSLSSDAGVDAGDAGDGGS